MPKISEKTGLSIKQIRTIREAYQEKLEKGINRDPRSHLLVKDRDAPIRDLVIKEGYPEIKRGKGRPGKYEKKKDYNFYDKYRKSLRKSN